MNKARVLSAAAIIALLSATGLAQAATDAKPAVEVAAAPVAAPAAAETKKAMTGKKHHKHHAKKKAAHAS